MSNSNHSNPVHPECCRQAVYRGSAPGKIIISGEWAVLEPGNPAIVTTTEQGVTATLTTSPTKNSLFVQHAIDVANEYLEKNGIKTYTGGVVIDSQISFGGLGSSAAVVVATIKAVLVQLLAATVPTIFRLSRIAHSRAQGNVGSGCDIAASVYGGTIFYTNPDQVKKITLPKDLKLSIGFSGYPSSTKDLIAHMHHMRGCKIYDAIAEVTRNLADAFEKNKKSDIILLIKENRQLLQKLSQESGVELETPELKRLCDIAESFGAAAKFSGAGGGDCAIAICFDNDTKNEIERVWNDNQNSLNQKVPGTTGSIVVFKTA